MKKNQKRCKNDIKHPSNTEFVVIFSLHPNPMHTLIFEHQHSLTIFHIIAVVALEIQQIFNVGLSGGVLAFALSDVIQKLSLEMISIWKLYRSLPTHQVIFEPASVDCSVRVMVLSSPIFKSTLKMPLIVFTIGAVLLALPLGYSLEGLSLESPSTCQDHFCNYNFFLFLDNLLMLKFIQNSLISRCFRVTIEGFKNSFGSELFDVGEDEFSLRIVFRCQ